MKYFLRTVLSIGTVLLALVYVLACLTPVISPGQWVIMGFLGLGFPMLLAAMFFTMVIWAFVKRKVALVLLLITAAGSYHIGHLFGLHAPSFTMQKKKGTVRVMGWNVMNFTKNNFPDPGGPDTSYPVFKYIQQQQPDIICMQDFYENDRRPNGNNLAFIHKKLGYPYYVFARDYVEDFPMGGKNYDGIAIFSKYPLQHIQHIPFKGKKMPHSVLTADITIRNVTRRIIVTHLQSMHLANLKLSDKGYWVRDEDSAINYSGSVYKKMAYYMPYHAQQARAVKSIIAKSPYPVIFSADMNEVPTAYSYYTIKGSLKDAFLEKGSGLGRTYYKISPTLRIDYLLHSPGIQVEQFKRDTVQLSDHYPLLMDVAW